MNNEYPPYLQSLLEMADMKRQEKELQEKLAKITENAPNPKKQDSNIQHTQPKLKLNATRNIDNTTNSTSKYNFDLGAYEGMYVPFIRNEQEYTRMKARVDALGDFLEGKWFDPKYEKLANEHQNCAERMLAYEIEHDMLPI